ncbi:hypothetical protein HMPREF1475_00922 [Hoylesella oralis HGA0225]|nr:hypothetical protein HMPREF1475_00922 [Hoylesella oralis HGA0225]SHG10332.1 hypothetical protein SAMN05444288_2357 [Hoylesella oralis]
MHCSSKNSDYKVIENCEKFKRSIALFNFYDYEKISNLLIVFNYLSFRSYTQMKKEYILKVLLLSWLLTVGVVSYGQKEDFRVEIHTQGSVSNQQFKPYELCCDIGYNLTDRLFVNLRGESAIALFKIGGQKDYYTNYIYGANAGYTMLKNDICNLDVRVGFGDNLRKKQDWKYNYYDAGVYAHIGKYKLKPCVGFGIRRYHSRNSLFKNYTRFYASIGISFGS